MKQIAILLAAGTLLLSGCVTTGVQGGTAVEQPEAQAEETLQEPVEMEPEASPEAVETPVAWSDEVPFGEGDINVLEWNGDELNNYDHPELGRLIQPDKAGPEFFLFFNQGAFQGEGHIRGVQVDWYDGADEKVEMTLDVTGTEPMVYNAELGEETGYQAYGRSNWPDDVVYQVFFEYNPSGYFLTYIEWEYRGELYAVGEYRTP